MDQKNHFTIRDESGGPPLVEITRRADVADGELVEILQLFAAATMEVMGETVAADLERSTGQAEQDPAGGREGRGRLTLVMNNESEQQSPLGLLIERAGLKESNVVDLELVRLRMKNAAMREALGHTRSEPEEG